MIEGIKVIERIGENGRVTHFRYKSLNAWWLTETLENATKEQLEQSIRESDERSERYRKSKAEWDARRAKLTPGERKAEDEYIRSLGERMQAEQDSVGDGDES